MSRIHLQNWYKWAENKDDYYFLFIKAWIPFNVWYHDKYYDSSTCSTDEKQIAKVKSEPNKVRDRIEGLLDSPSETGKMFRKYLTELHYELSDHPQSDRRGQINLNNMWAAFNTITTSQHVFGQHRYSVMEIARTGGGKEYKLDIVKKRSGNTDTTFNIPKRSIKALEEHPVYQALNETKKSHLKKCIEDILERKPSNVVLGDGECRKPVNSIEIGIEKKLYLKNDKIKIAQVVIQLLYQLRCLIFHGELEPTDSNMNIYKYAYHIQSLLNEEFV